MASNALSLLLFLALSVLSCTIRSSNAADCVGSGNISVYWGQHSDDSTEGSLKEACDSSNYNIVILESLIVYDNGDTPVLNLANHCGTSSNPCSNLEPSIKHCQDLGIKVFLSIGLDVVTTPPPEGKNVTLDLANYLVDSYLSGNDGPLGAVSLDGIDIQDVSDSEHLHWDLLVTLLSNGSTIDRKVYISVSPQCVYPDQRLGPVIETGHVDYIWVEFYYNNPSCIYQDGNPENLFKAWKQWTSNVPESLIFLGLTADKTMAGYIDPEVVKTEILPTVKKASNYGGVMIWDRYFDLKNNYTAPIKDSVPRTCKCVCDGDDTASTRFNSLLARS